MWSLDDVVWDKQAQRVPPLPQLLHTRVLIIPQGTPVIPTSPASEYSFPEM